ncbi:NAD(P)H-dependent flavin oxidoreductase [Luteibacter yeojuensis]|uniref:Nitronate monooxygenase n=1 Tax=Luteibacter yeojuensis TaxID=345309 RepID=A0A0F3KWU9_9GAMM|nr:nitronate monooxygenase [Luteibacter yeojuensis]KJV35745.1 2-nitropropane dioxygenase [Luteibacter yeojuensis]
MASWHDRRLLDLFRIDTPLLLAPMAGSGGSALAIAVAKAGGLGAIPCASISVEKATEEVATFRGAVAAPLNLNFFAHAPKAATDSENTRWLERLAPYFKEFGVDTASLGAAGGRAPFDDAMCRMVERLKPEVVSFHFGLPAKELLARVHATGARVIASATTVAEGHWLAEHGADAVIAQGNEAGGHRGNFLTDDMASQPGLFALLPQMTDALAVPVIAAGAIADGRGMAAALTLGAAAVQVGTAFLRSDESVSAAVHKAALATARDDNTAVTNVLTGRPARGIINRVMREVGPLSPDAPPFPLAGGPLAPLRAATEKLGHGDFQPLWSGQAGALAREGRAEAIARAIADQAAALLPARGAVA